MPMSRRFSKSRSRSRRKPPWLGRLLPGFVLGLVLAGLGSSAGADAPRPLPAPYSLPQLPLPRYPLRQIAIEVDNATQETFPAFRVQVDAARWVDLGPIRPGSHRLRVLKQVPDMRAPGSYRLQRADGGWLLGAYWYSGDHDVRLRLDAGEDEPGVLSSGAGEQQPGYLEAVGSGDGTLLAMACHGIGVMYGGMVCESEYLVYAGRGWGLALFPLTMGGFSSSSTVDELLRRTSDVVATSAQSGMGYVQFRYNPRDTVDIELARWFGSGGLGIAEFRGGFHAPPF